MPNKIVKSFIYTHKNTNQVLFIKKAFSGDYVLHLNDVKTTVVNGEVSKYEKDDTITIDSEQLAEIVLLKKKISTMLLLITNMEMQKENIQKSFSAGETKSFFDRNGFDISQQQKCSELLIVEKDCLFKKLETVRNEYTLKVDNMKTVLDLDHFYSEIRNTVVMGSYVNVNKLKEDL